MRITPRRALLITLLVVIVLLVPIPLRGRAWVQVQDLAHVPLAGLLALATWFGLRGRLPRSDVAAAIVVWGGVTALLALLELVQGYVKRGQSWHDALTNAAAAAAFLLVAVTWPRRATARWIGMCFAVALIALVSVRPVRTLYDMARQTRAMPLIASFEDDLEMERWRGGVDSRIRRSTEHGTHGLYSLRVDLDPGRWPGATLSWPTPDWSGWREIVFDVFVDGLAPLTLTLKVADEDCDHTYYDAFHRKFTLAPGRHEVRVALDDVRNGPRGRKTDLTQVVGWQVFVTGLETPRAFFLDHLRLVGRVP